MVAVPEAIPRELRERAQWVCWAYRPGPDGKPTKVPMCPRGGAGSSTNPRTWGTFEQADLERVRRGHDGIGFVLWKGRAADAHLKPSARHDRRCPGVDTWHFEKSDPPADPFSGADLDHCLNGRVDAWAGDVVRDLASYTEITPSGSGLRVFVIGTLPPGARKVGNLELYDSGRYLTVTGNHYDDTPLELAERTEALKRVHARMVAGVGVPKAHPKAATTTTFTPLSDDELVKKACQAANGHRFARLWAGDTSMHNDDDSRADEALISHLAFWTDGDETRIDSLFRKSQLYRPKWDERRSATGETYGQVTMRKVLASRGAGYSTVRATVPDRAVVVPEGAGIRSLRSLMDKDLQPPRFIVPGLLSPGLFILAGKPKIGKSWLALNVALAVASGGVAIGRIPIEEPIWTLLLALEDTEWRLKDRVGTVLGPGAVIPERFDYDLECPKLTEGGLEKIGAWLENKPRGALVWVDVWKRVKPPSAKGANAYDADYEAGQMLKALADKYGACIVVLHHLNKIVSDDDVDTISGSIGFSGVADGHIVMKKAGKNGAVLRGRGRDVQEFDHALEWAPDVGTWSILGDSDVVQQSMQLREAVEILERAGPLTPSDYATAAELPISTAKSRLWRWARDGHLVSLKGGTYYTAQSVPPTQPMQPDATVQPAPSQPVALPHMHLQPDATGALFDPSPPRLHAVAPVARLHTVAPVASEDLVSSARCRGWCGERLKGSEEQGGICRACEQQEIENANAEL